MKLLEYRVTYPSALAELCLPPYPGTLFFSAQSSSPSSFRLPVCWGAKRKKSLLPSICVYQVCAPLLVTCKRLIHPGAPRDNLSVPQVKQNWLPIWPWLKHLLQSDIIPVPAYFVASCRENTLLRCPATISCAQRLVKTSEVIEEIQIEDLGTIVEDMSAHGVYNQQKNKNNTSKLLGNEWKEVIWGMSAELNKAILVAPCCTSYCFQPRDCGEHFDPLEGQILDSTRSQLPPVFLQQFSALCIDEWAPSVHHKSLAEKNPCHSAINTGIPFMDLQSCNAVTNRPHQFQARVWDMQLHFLPNMWDLFLAEVSHSQHIHRANPQHLRYRWHGDHVHGQETEYDISTKGPDSEPSKNP